MQAAVASPEPAPQNERPWLFAILIAPAAVVSVGLVGGGLSYLLRREGIDPGRSSQLIALLSLPHSIYFLWASITDFLIERRIWLISAATAAAAAIVVSFLQTSLASPMAVGLLLLACCLGMLEVSSCGGMMAALRSEVNRRRGGSFYQIGSLAISGIAVFLLVSLSARVPRTSLGWVIAALILLPAIFAFAAPRNAPFKFRRAASGFRNMGREFKATFLRWEAIPYTILIALPMSSGAMLGLLPGIATDYGVNGPSVAWINGISGALLTAAGSAAAALIPVRVRAPIAFVLAGLINAAALAILALGPMRPATYLTGTVLFLLSIGAGYALFTGVVLEFMGEAGNSGSGRYAIINSIGNIPVAYMSFVDGLGYHRWGTRALPATDAVLSAGCAIVMLIWLLAGGLPRRASQQASEA